jgi:hypothetical protein
MFSRAAALAVPRDSAGPRDAPEAADTPEPEEPEELAEPEEPEESEDAVGAGDTARAAGAVVSARTATAPAKAAAGTRALIVVRHPLALTSSEIRHGTRPAEPDAAECAAGFDLASPAVTVSVRNAAHALALVKSVPIELHIALLELQ